MPIIMNRLPQLFKFVVSRNLSPDLWDLTELLKIMKLKITARKNCEYSSDHNAKNDNFMSQDCLGSALAQVDSTETPESKKKKSTAIK